MKSNKGALNYFVLIIFTDGLNFDERETIEKIIEMSGQPISLIIIGIGSENFEQMHYLDGDNELLKAGGQRAKRDIV